MAKKADPPVFTNSTLELIRQISDRALELNNPNFEDWMDEVRGYLSVGSYLGPTINFEKPKSIRHAQKALARMESHLDRILVLQHDAKRVLQIISSVETQLLGKLVRDGALPAKATGPAQQQMLAASVPRLARVKTSWETLEQICLQAQQRIASAKKAMELQARLDDNLRWAQYRNPG